MPTQLKKTQAKVLADAAPYCNDIEDLGLICATSHVGSLKAYSVPLMQAQAARQVAAARRGSRVRPAQVGL